MKETTRKKFSKIQTTTKLERIKDRKSKRRNKKQNEIK